MKVLSFDELRSYKILRLDRSPRAGRLIETCVLTQRSAGDGGGGLERRGGQRWAARS
jgi:hypothetical protein